MGKVITLPEMVAERAKLKASGKKLVFTNGCFDILHVGHVRLLREAAAFGDTLVVAVNDDGSVRRLKGSERPINPENARGEVLAALQMVDYIVLFSEDDPGRIIHEIVPDILVKGGDWSLDQIVGRDFVESHGGKVISIPLVPGYSTTGILDKLNKNPDPS